MTTTRTIRKKLDYLVRATGRPETDIMAEAVQQGLEKLYRKQIAEAYLSGKLERKKAAAELGDDLVEDLDYARKSVESDVKWGLESA
jgi:predicted DNA-binding protein